MSDKVAIITAGGSGMGAAAAKRLAADGFKVAILSSSGKGEALAKELGIAAGDKVKVSSKRGAIKAVAVVTKRIKPMKIEGKTVHHVGIPIHWGFKGVTKPGYLANTLTPFVGDGNSNTPEFKTFLVKVEKA